MRTVISRMEADTGKGIGLKKKGPEKSPALSQSK
jgi:hypothetical protein